MPDIVLITIGLVNIVASFLCALHIFRSRARSTYIYWGLMHLSYALMPFFGLGDDLIGLQSNTRLDFIMGGFSIFFSTLTLVFYLFAALIDATSIKPGKLVNAVLIIVIVLQLILFQVPALFSFSRTVFRVTLLPAGIFAFLLFGRYLHSKKHLLSTPGVILVISFVFSLSGYLSLLLFDAGNPWKGYGWYLFSWMGVAGLWLTWYLSLRLDKKAQ